MTLVLDADGLIALEGQSRDVMAILKYECMQGRVPITHGGIVGQVWRGGSGRQAKLARVLPSVEIVGLDQGLGKRAGMLLKKSRTSDVIDAAIVSLTNDGDQILTSDVDDIVHLVEAAGLRIDVVPV